MADNKFQENVNSLLAGMDHFLTTKSVVGDAIHLDENTVLLPLVDMSFGVGTGAFEGKEKSSGAGGLGGKVTPSAVVVVQNGMVRIMNIRNMDTVNKIVDMVPDFVNRFASMRSSHVSDDDVRKAAFQEEE